MPYGYKIDKGNVVVIWGDEEGTPGNIIQPTWPNGTKWKNKDEAEKWAKTFVAYAEDNSKPAPGSGPDKPVLTKEDLEPSEEEKAAVEALNKKIEEEVAKDAAEVAEAAAKAAEAAAAADAAAGIEDAIIVEDEDKK